MTRRVGNCLRRAARTPEESGEDEKERESKRSRSEVEGISRMTENVVCNVRNHREIVEESWWPDMVTQRSVVFINGGGNTEDRQWRKRDSGNVRCPPGLEDTNKRAESEFPHPNATEDEAMEVFIHMIVNDGKVAPNPGTTKGWCNSRAVILRGMPQLEAAIVVQWCMRLPGICETREEHDEYYLHFSEKVYVVSAINIWGRWNVMGGTDEYVQAERPYIREGGSENIYKVKTGFYLELNSMREKANRVEVREEMSAKEVDIVLREGGSVAWQEVEKHMEYRPGLTWDPGG